MIKPSDLRNQVATAIHAAESKKAENIAILQMDKSASAFTDFQLISSGTNPRQVQAIADEVEFQLKQTGVYPNSIEGFQRAEWILLDYVDFVVHVFSEGARKFYDLERLWKSAKHVTLEDLKGRPSRARTSPVRSTRKKPVKPKSVAAIGKAVRSATSRNKPKPKSAKAKKASAKKKSDKSKSRRRSR